MKYMKDVTKSLEKAGISVGKSAPPEHWITTGNYAQNKIISGSFMRGIPLGRITAFGGPSGAGKSFNVVNLMREAQLAGAYVVAIDSENALDDNFVEKLGVTTDEESYAYISANTVNECKKIVSDVMKGYKKENELNDPEADKLLIVIDSLSMLMTKSEENDFEKGEVKGDFGGKNKQLKAMLQSFTNAIKGTNVGIVITSQVYENQDYPMNGKPRYIFPDSVRYSCSQIVMVSALVLKDKATKAVQGVRMKCENYKSRFAKFGSSITMLVPYEEGMDPFSGLLEIAVDLDVVSKNGAWYTHKKTGEKFQEKKFSTVAEEVLKECEALTDVFLVANLMDGEVEDTGDGKSSKAKRAEKFADEDE